MLRKVHVLKPINTFTWPVRVYYEDTDAGGIVYHSAYLKFMERARTEWLRDLGFEQDILMEHSTAFVVKSVQMEYFMAARFNEMLSISSQVVELKRASLVFKQTVLNASQQPLVQALIKVACIDITTMKPKAIPKNILGEFSRVI